MRIKLVLCCTVIAEMKTNLVRQQPTRIQLENLNIAHQDPVYNLYWIGLFRCLLQKIQLFIDWKFWFFCWKISRNLLHVIILQCRPLEIHTAGCLASSSQTLLSQDEYISASGDSARKINNKEKVSQIHNSKIFLIFKNDKRCQDNMKPFNLT